ncbi:hypothetical protein HK104_002059 [Borealophlyctis nickersoniae]|nr:hypothetical protein HK104_002059 [Borealophlyctis nickersoniae]
MCKPTSSDSILPPITGPRQFTWDEIESSKSKASSRESLVVIHGKVYDIGGDFVKWHPGGSVALSQLGNDASGAFDVFHGEGAQEVMGNFYVGDLAEGEIRKPNDIQHLRTRIASLNLYASSKLYYSYKMLSTLSILGASVYVLLKWRDNTLAAGVAGVLVALFWQQAGWLAHDFAHHQVFAVRKWNDYVSYFLGNACQGFSVAWWKHRHSSHHSVPNVHGDDPDVKSMPIFWSDHALEFFTDYPAHKLAQFFVANQPILYFPLLGFARLAWAARSIMWNLPGSKMRDELPTAVVVEQVTLMVHWAWYVGLIATLSWPRALLFVLLSQTVSGLFLAIVFSVNHNGMPVFLPHESKLIDFYHLQVVTGRDVTPTWFNNWFTGGLNYQIEHHMFPTIPRHNLPKIAPMVQELCRKHGIPYHCTSLVDGVGEVVGRLMHISRMAKKMKKC